MHMKDARHNDVPEFPIPLFLLSLEALAADGDFGLERQEVVEVLRVAGGEAD
jgi:hypothetical protein